MSSAIAAGVLSLVVFVIIAAALEALPLRFTITHKPPAGGRPSPRPARATPPTARAPQPGLIPPAPVTHPSPVVRLADVRACGCAWVWRGRERGWQQEYRGNRLGCQPLPTPDQWDCWSAQLWDSR